MNYPNTVLVIESGEIKKIHDFGIMGWRDEHYEMVDAPDGVEKLEYKSTDAWRGYHYPVIEDGYMTVADGWATGRWSDVPWKHKFNDFVDALSNGSMICPVKIVITCGLTSNVFSTSINVIIAESDFDKFNEWMVEESGMSIEDMKSALV